MDTLVQGFRSTQREPQSVSTSTTAEKQFNTKYCPQLHSVPTISRPVSVISVPVWCHQQRGNHAPFPSPLLQFMISRIGVSHEGRDFGERGIIVDNHAKVLG